VVTQERINELIKEKTELRNTFEESIRKLRNAHDQDISEKQNRLQEQKGLSFK